MGEGIIGLCIAASALAAIVADRRRSFKWVYLFKPLTLVLIIGLTLVNGHPAGPAYERLVLAGLVSSLAGDVFLMLRNKRFLQGLICFLIAHGFYLTAFLSRLSGRISLGPALAFLVYMIFMLGLLWTRLGRLRIPVVVYMLVLTAMASLAAERFWLAPEAGAVLALAGSILFVASDSFLAANRFVREFRSAQVLILSTYFAAQALIALSA